MNINIKSIQSFFLFQKYSWSVFILLLFHVSGIIGMSTIYKDWFVNNTPINLGVCFVILILNEEFLSLRLLFIWILFILVGFLAEYIGVNYGILFGNYYYGDMLGFQFKGVPIIIGINWLVIIYCSIHIVHFLCIRLFKGSKIILPVNNLSRMEIIGVSFFIASIATCFDYIMEPGAIKLGFWTWESGNLIPLLNYITWFVISWLLSIGFLLFKVPAKNLITIPLFIIQLVFFIIIQY
jgi:putative membrane protein